jgi:Endonuclease NucS C-terminal domain/EVE domain
MSDQFWGLGERTPNRRALKKGDRLVFYVGSPEMVFAGTATLASDSYQPDGERLEELSHGMDFYKPEYGVDLTDVEVWESPRSAPELVPNLEFIENKQAWFTYFQGGIRWVSETDFHLIVGSRQVGLVEQLTTTRDLENPAEFALENHLEDFMYANWRTIDFHSQLRLFELDGQNGRQFPAGAWSIDFLCIDEASKEFVVLELKRGKSSDSTVGQVLRYISWVKENLAAPSQGVRGIIVAHDADEALRYAVRAVPNVEVLTYSVSFALAEMQLS